MQGVLKKIMISPEFNLLVFEDSFQRMFAFTEACLRHKPKCDCAKVAKLILANRQLK